MMTKKKRFLAQPHNLISLFLSRSLFLPFPNPNPGGPLIDEHCYIVQAFVGGGTLKRAVAAQNEATKASLTSSCWQQQPPSTSTSGGAAAAPSTSTSSPSPSPSSSMKRQRPPPPPPSPIASIRCFYTHADAARWGSQIAEGLAYLHGKGEKEKEGERKNRKRKKTRLFPHSQIFFDFKKMKQEPTRSSSTGTSSSRTCS